jgi:hypothetical protein
VIVVSGIGIAQRQAFLDLDYGAPATATQKALEALKIARVRTFAWAFLTGQVVWWVPFMIVLFKGVLGVDLYATDFMRQFMAINVAAGLLFIPFAIWACGRISGRLEGSSALARLIDAIAGRDIVAARAFLGKLAEFERA